MGFFLSLLSGFLPMLLYAGFVYWLDRYEKEPKVLLGGVFIWGAVVAAGAAFFINTLLGIGIYLFTNSESVTEWTTSSIIAPIIEETLKGLAVLVVYLVFLTEFDSVLDGIIYAAITALGFAASENVYYIYTVGFLKGQYAGLLAMTFVRVLLVGWQHPFYTSFIGIGLAFTRLSRNLVVKFAAPVVGWSVAVFFHSLHNTLLHLLSDPGGFLFNTATDWTGWVFIFIVVLLAIRSEQHNIALQLEEEVNKGVISKEQYLTAYSAWAQSLASLGALRSGQYRSTRRFYQLAAELAHKKRQLSQMGEEIGNSAIIEQLRQELSSLSPLAHP